MDFAIYLILIINDIQLVDCLLFRDTQCLLNVINLKLYSYEKFKAFVSSIYVAV